MQLQPFLRGIADAIRGKEGSTVLIPAADFASRIASLPSGEDEIDGLVEGTLTELVNDRVTSIKESLFLSPTTNKYLKKVSCENVVTINENAFYFCEKLSSASLPATTTILEGAFIGCRSLEEVTFPRLMKIYANAFANCSVLQVFDFGGNDDSEIPAEINDYVFFGCGRLKAFISRHNLSCVLYSDGAFEATPIASGTGYIYVPRSLVDAYKTADQWSTYASQFRALEDYTVDGTTTGELDPSKI